MDVYPEEDEPIDIHADTGNIEAMNDVKAEKVDSGDGLLIQPIRVISKTVSVKSLDEHLNLIENEVETLSDAQTSNDDCSSHKSSLQIPSTNIDGRNELVKTQAKHRDNLNTGDDDKMYPEEVDDHQAKESDKSMFKDHDPNSNVPGIDNNEKDSKPDKNTDEKKHRSGNRKGTDSKYIYTSETVPQCGTISWGKVSSVVLRLVLDILIMNILQYLFTNEPLNKMRETTKWIFNSEFEFILDITLYVVPYLPENTALYMWDSAEILRDILQDAIRRHVLLETEQFRLATFRLYRGLSNVITRDILKLAKNGFFCDIDGRIRCYHCDYTCNIERAEAETHDPNCLALENTSEFIADSYGREAPRFLTQGAHREDDGHILLRENGFTSQVRLGQTTFMPTEGGIQESSPVQEHSVCSVRNGIQESQLPAVVNSSEPVNTHQPVGFESACVLIPSSCNHNICHSSVDFASTNRASNLSNERNSAASLRESSIGPTFVTDAETREETHDAQEVRINSGSSDRRCSARRPARSDRPVNTHNPDSRSCEAYLPCLYQRSVINSEQANTCVVSSNEQSRTGRIETNTEQGALPRNFQTPTKAESETASEETRNVLHNESQDVRLTGVRTNTERTPWPANIPTDNQFKDLAENKHDNRVRGMAFTKDLNKSLQNCSTRDGSSDTEISTQTTAKKPCTAKRNSQTGFAETRDRKDTEKLKMSGVPNDQRSSLPETYIPQSELVLEKESEISGSDVSATFQQNTTNKSSKAEQMPHPESGKETNVGMLQTQRIPNQPCLLSSVNSPTLDEAPSTRQNIPNANETESVTESACSTSAVNQRNRPTDSRGAQMNSISAGSTQPQTMDFSTNRHECNNSQYASCPNRERSFRGIRCFHQSRKRMAQAGQYYKGPGDITCCYKCGNLLKDWQHDDDPFVEHARIYPKCPLSQQHTRDLETLQETIQETLQETSQSTQRDMSASSENTSSDDSIIVENEIMRQMLKCCLCESERSDRVGLPCGHMFMCHQCCDGVKLCLKCGANITEIQSINNP